VGRGKSRKSAPAIDRGRRALARQIKEALRERGRETREYHLIDESLINKAARVVSEADVVTPSSLATALGVKVSIAKAIMRHLIESNQLEVIDRSRELIIAIPKRE